MIDFYCPTCKNVLQSLDYRDAVCECKTDKGMLVAPQLLRFLKVILASTKALPARYFIPLPDGELPYLERFVLEERPDGSKVYLHVIYASDCDRDPHDHPFDFKSTIIWGSYSETEYYFRCGECGGTTDQFEKCCTTTKPRPEEGTPVIYSAGESNVKRAAQLHRLTVVKGPVVTLVERGPKVREWGFQTPDGWEHHASYIKRKFPDAQPTEVD